MNGAFLIITPLIFCTTCIFQKLLNLKELLYVFYLYFELVRSFMTYKLVDMLLDSSYLYRTDLNMSFNIFIICMGGLIKFYQLISIFFYLSRILSSYQTICPASCDLTKITIVL